ncbi:MAG: DNA polymerase ligase N-terminal domain-containing protein [Nitrososphaerales archaeon]|jgi:bifunctional non-homologous end joining protein LigD
MKADRDSQRLVFVIQKHKATTLHYDFRLEVGGVMPSWSIPRGPSLESGVRRLAMPTSNHDLEYRHFEGVIPSGRFGAGPVMVWDEGTYSPEVEVSKGVRREVTTREEAEKVAKAGMKEGSLKFRLYGKKLRGSFALIRTAGFRGKESWLLIKHKDEYSRQGYDAKDYDFSAVSNRTLAQIAGQTEIGSPQTKQKTNEEPQPPRAGKRRD